MASQKRPENLNDLISVRVHRRAWERLALVAATLIKRAEEGIPIPIRVELGRTHLLDVLVDKIMKELHIDVPK